MIMYMAPLPAKSTQPSKPRATPAAKREPEEREVENAEAKDKPIGEETLS
jgi:hypothetical protein